MICYVDVKFSMFDSSKKLVVYDSVALHVWCADPTHETMGGRIQLHILIVWSQLACNVINSSGKLYIIVITMCPGANQVWSFV
jgi:hypothetical protein